MATFAQEIVHHLQDAPAIHDEDAADVVEAADAAHARHLDDDLVEDGDAATDQSRVPSLRHHGQHVLVAVFQHLADFLGRLGLQDEPRVAGVLLHPVGVVCGDVVRGVRVDSIDHGGLVAERGPEEFDVRGRDLGEPCVSLQIRVEVCSVFLPLGAREILRRVISPWGGIGEITRRGGRE